jgi:SLIT-ROBO Rho GTPase activating protein
MTNTLEKRDRQVLLDFEASIRDFNKQFGDQQRILDVRNENRVALVTDIQEFFKRRSELDLEYGKNLDRICERFQERLQKQRAMYGFQKKDRASYVNLWSKLLIDTRFKAKTATTLSEIYSKNIVTRLTEIAEDIQRIARSVKDTHLLLEVEIKKQINVLQTDMRKYYMKHNEYNVSKNKYDVSDENKKKAEESPLKKGNERQLKKLEKTLEKKRGQMHQCKETSTNSRNEYILSLNSVLSILNKYYHHDLSDIIMKYDHNFHNSVSATLQTFIGAEVRMATAQVQATDSLAHSVKTMDAENDIKMFLEDNESSFIPDMKKFTYIPAAHDDIHSITAGSDACIEQDLNTKQKQLNSQITTLQVELSDLQVQMEKRVGGLDATYKKYDAEMNGFYHIDMTLSGSTPTSSTLTSNPPQQLKIDKEDWENGLMSKFKEKIMSENLLHQKQAKFDTLTKALGEIALCPRNSSVLSGNKRSVKLFGTSLKYQLDETAREIPDIVESCAKYIARFGKEWSTKYDYSVRVSMEKNNKNAK